MLERNEMYASLFKESCNVFSSEMNKYLHFTNGLREHLTRERQSPFMFWREFTRKHRRQMKSTKAILCAQLSIPQLKLWKCVIYCEEFHRKSLQVNTPRIQSLKSASKKELNFNVTHFPSPPLHWVEGFCFQFNSSHEFALFPTVSGLVSRR